MLFQKEKNQVIHFYGSRYRGKEFQNLMNIIKTKYSPIYKDISLIPELPSDFPKCYSNYSLRKAFYFAQIAKRNGNIYFNCWK